MQTLNVSCHSPSPLKQVHSKGSSKWHVLFATWLGAFFDGFDATIFVMVLYPCLSELLHTQSHSEVGKVGAVVLACFMAGWAAGAIIFGALADRIGRTKTMMLTVLLYAAFTGLCGTAHNWQELAFYRFLVGCGIGGEVGIGGVLLSESWGGDKRLHALGVMVSAFGVGYLATSVLNLFIGHLGWRVLFFVGIVPALLTVYFRLKLKDSEEFCHMSEARKVAREKPRGARSAEEEKLLESAFRELFAVENRQKILVIICMASSAIVGYWAVLGWIPAWVNQLTGTAAIAERSMTTIALNIGLVVFAVLGGPLVSRIGRENYFRLGALGSFACCLVMFLGVKSFGPLLLILAFLTGGFTIMPFVLLFIYVPELFDTRIRGTAFGFSYNLGRLFAGGAALYAGQLIGYFGGSYALAAAVLSGVYIFGAVASCFMAKSTGQVTSYRANVPSVVPAIVQARTVESH